MVAGQFDLDHVSTQLGSDLGGISYNIDGGFTLFAQAATTWIGPDNDGQTGSLGLFGEFVQLLVHFNTLR